MAEERGEGCDRNSAVRTAAAAGEGYRRITRKQEQLAGKEKGREMVLFSLISRRRLLV